MTGRDGVDPDEATRSPAAGDASRGIGDPAPAASRGRRDAGASCMTAPRLPSGDAPRGHGGSDPAPRGSAAAPAMVAVSGGVDSAVALMRLVEAGVAVQAMFMKNWEEDDRDGHCAAAEDLADAQRVCGRLGVPLHAVNCSDAYWDNVFTPFLRDLEAGTTPNPDVLCNREVKFSAFVDHARRLGAERVATGHYARVERTADGVRLLKGVDPDKDQSYFLHALDQPRLARTMFPLGTLHKRTVREMARRAGLAPHGKRDSTGLCFIGERRFAPFLARFIDQAPGPIETGAGVRIGEHRGLAFFTIGQRKGLGIGGRRGGAQAPWYVAAKDYGRNALIVVRGRDHPALLSRKVWVRAMHWIAGEAPPLPLRCGAKLRYRQADQACTARPGEHGDALALCFDRPQWAAAPGQYAVLYDGDECLGGGVIESAGAGAPREA